MMPDIFLFRRVFGSGMSPHFPPFTTSSYADRKAVFFLKRCLRLFLAAFFPVSDDNGLFAYTNKNIAECVFDRMMNEVKSAKKPSSRGSKDGF